MKKTLLLTFLFLSTFLLANDEKTTQIKGIIKDNIVEMPIQGVLILLENSEKQATSDKNGVFYFPNLKVGERYTLILQKEGFKQKEVSINVKTQVETEVELTLSIDGFDLDNVVVKAEKSISAASSKILNTLDFELRPRNSAQDMLKIVPGLFIAQHAGGGKAEQIFLRGFDCDHGTDVASFVDGIPVNMPSHGHGQGYLDLHFLTPEAVKNVEIQKGTYFAEQGDFATAGAISFKTLDKLERNIAQIDVASTPSQRFLSSSRALLAYELPFKNNKINSYFIGESIFAKGYFNEPQNFIRHNLMSKTVFKPNQNTKIALLLTTFKSTWDASGQIPERAITAKLIDRFGYIDNSEGGNTGRQNASLTFTKIIDNQQFESQIYYSKYDFQLFSNFTFFLRDSINGDEIEQIDNRQIVGWNSKYAFEKGKNYITFGANLRADFIENQLSNAVRRSRLDDVAKAKINQQNIAIYVKDEIALTPKFRAEIGLRNQLMLFDVSDKLPYDATRENYSGKNYQYAFLPKINLNYSLSNRYKIFFNIGKGFHSNDARSVVQDKTNHVLPAAWGSELGLSLRPSSKLLINIAFWTLNLDNELVFIGDEGTTENNGASRRFGIDMSTRWKISEQFSANVDVNLSNSILIEKAFGKRLKEDYLIPLAPRATATGGLLYRSPFGLESSLQVRHISARPANEANTVIAKGYTIFDFNVNYFYKKNKISLSVENLLNTNWNEAQFDTESYLTNFDKMPVSELHFTPGSPLSLKIGYTRNF